MFPGRRKKTLLVGLGCLIFFLIAASLFYFYWPSLKIRYYIAKLSDPTKNIVTSRQLVSELDRREFIALLKYIKIHPLQDYDHLLKTLSKVDPKILGDTYVVNLLLDLSHSKVARIRQGAFYLMAHLGTSNPKVVPRFLKALKYETDINVLFAVLWGATVLRDKRFSVPLSEIVTFMPSRLNLRPMAALALGYCCHDEKTREIFFRCLEDKDSRVRNTALLALRNIHDKKSIRIAISLLNDPDALEAGIALHALYALKHLTPETFGDNIGGGDGWKFYELYPTQKQDVIKRWKQWLEENEDYLYWSEKDNHFVIDEEAKKAGIPTEEYRKTHPWSKEKE